MISWPMAELSDKSSPKALLSPKKQTQHLNYLINPNAVSTLWHQKHITKLKKVIKAVWGNLSSVTMQRCLQYAPGCIHKSI